MRTSGQTWTLSWLAIFGHGSLGWAQEAGPTTEETSAQEQTPGVPAESGSAGSVTRVGGLIFSHWGLDLSEGADSYNEFDIDRAYLTARRDLGEDFAVRVTTDVGRVDGEETRLRPFLKYAYLELVEVAPGVKLRIGMAGNSLIGTHDDFWGHRYIRKSFADAHGIISSADMGVYAIGEHMDGALSWQAAVVNGEGYDVPEFDVAKTAQVQLGYDLLSGTERALPFVVYASTDLVTDTPEITVVGSVGFEHDRVTFLGHLTTRVADDVRGLGCSAALVPHLGQVGNVILRYDHWDVDAGSDDDAMDTIVGGLSHDFASKVSIAATYERVTIEAAPDAPSHGAFLRTQAGF